MDFEGYPLRKDWQEAFYEDDVKPFKSRWPEGKFTMAEQKNPLGDNVRYPAGFDPEKWVPTDPEELLYASLKKYQSEDKDGVKTDHFVVNMGPQHPSTHGVFRAVVVLNGETIVSLKPVMGYLHRNHEKIGERNTYPAEYALHRPAGLFQLDDQQLGVCAGCREVDGTSRCRNGLNTSASSWRNSAVFKIT